MRLDRRLVIGAGALLVVVVLAAGGLWVFALNGHQSPTTAMTHQSASSSATASLGLTPTPAASRSQVPLLSTLVPAPSPRNGAAMVYDASRKNVVVFGGCSGGCTGSDYLGDTWTWDGSHWAQRTPAKRPPARYRPAIAYDADLGVVVMFGGAKGDFSDTWTWDGTSWSEMHPTSSPVPLFPGTTEMDYDPVLHRVALFAVGTLPDHSGLATETWTWDGKDWTPLNPPQSPLFPQGFAFTMAYYPPANKLVLVASELWAFDGRTWSRLESPGNRPTGDPGMAYDASNGTFVFFNNPQLPATPINRQDTWTWDGAAWSNPTPPMSPPYLGVFGGPSMAYDGARGAVVLFGGATFDGSSNLLWTWDGSTWIRGE